jgi:transglutaminase-like putative cysteine protease
VLALPSFPTRRVTIGLLAFGGLAAARHAALPGVDVLVLVVWAAATLAALLLLDRAQADATPRLASSTPLPSPAWDLTRVGAVLAMTVFVAVVALAPTIAQAVRRELSPGRSPTVDDVRNSPGSLRTSDRLDMTSRPRLSDAVVFTVQASHPDFWRGETWDVWDGAGWRRSDPEPTAVHRTGEHVEVNVDPYDPAARDGEEMRQTFRVEAPYSDVIFAAPSPVDVRVSELVVGRSDGTLAIIGGFGRGASYTVVSRRAHATRATLRAADTEAVPAPVKQRYAQVPATTARVRQLAEDITAPAPTTYDKVRAIERWLADNTEYSLDAPLSAPGRDVVDEFVFESRRGWCEQVASTLVVMLRSVGVPARVATGFVTGKRDPLTGRYVVRERDAHAWAEVYFPGVGWQGFDPTASVPLAGEAANAKSWLEQARDALPFVVLVVVLAGAAAFVMARWSRRRAERTPRKVPSWGATMFRRLERLGRRAEVEPDPAQTVREYADVLADRLADPELVTVGACIDADAYAPNGVGATARAHAEQTLARAEQAVRQRPGRRRARVLPSPHRSGPRRAGP